MRRSHRLTVGGILLLQAGLAVAWLVFTSRTPNPRSAFPMVDIELSYGLTSLFVLLTVACAVILIGPWQAATGLVVAAVAFFTVTFVLVTLASTAWGADRNTLAWGVAGGLNAIALVVALKG